MGEVIKVDNFQLCSICRKRQAKFLCDMPIGKTKTLHITNRVKLPDGAYTRVTDFEKSFKEYTITCDRVVCERCAIKVSEDIHFCKICKEKLK